MIEDCVRWVLEHERMSEPTGQLPMVAVEARFGERRAGEKEGSLSQSEPIEIELASGPLFLNGRGAWLVPSDLELFRLPRWLRRASPFLGLGIARPCRPRRRSEWSLGTEGARLGR
jgi:hypothetical protein